MGLSSKQVSADTPDWSQIGELDIPKPTNVEAKDQQQKRPLLKCPRCDSTNTKFCYYNNYSKLQPRHFCRSCKRHWTEGGTLRNVPVGGCRRNKRAKTYHDSVNTVSQQQQLAVPFSGEIDTATFPDIFRQLLFESQPPPLPSVLASPSQLLGEMGINQNFYSGCTSSDSSSSLYSLKGQELVGSEESMISLMDGYVNGGDWLQVHDPLAQPSSYQNLLG